MNNDIKIKKIIDFERSFWDEKDTQGSIQLYSEIFDQNLLTYSPLGSTIGHYSLHNAYSQWLGGFPGIQMHHIKFNIIDSLAFWEWESSCIHEGIFNGIQPTGKKINFIGKTIYQFHGNKITNYLCYLDMTNVYNQLGYFLQKNEYDNQHIIKNDFNLLIDKLIDLTQSTGAKLTSRELEILSCWLLGQSLKTIAQIFCISPRTVESHIEHIKCKLSCNSKYELQNFVESKNIYHLFRDLYLIVTSNKIKCSIN